MGLGGGFATLPKAAGVMGNSPLKLKKLYILNFNNFFCIPFSLSLFFFSFFFKVNSKSTFTHIRVGLTSLKIPRAGLVYRNIIKLKTLVRQCALLYRQPSIELYVLCVPCPDMFSCLLNINQ